MGITLIIVAKMIAPVGRETDRRWEQGEDISLEFRVLEYRERGNLAKALPSEIKEWSRIPVRLLIRKSGLSQKVVYAILRGKTVRESKLAKVRRALENVAA
jgi:hypothetical protein